MDMAERKGSALRRLLRSAERRSDRATATGSSRVKTPGSRSSASLVVVTLAEALGMGGFYARGKGGAGAQRPRRSGARRGDPGARGDAPVGEGEGDPVPPARVTPRRR